MTSDKKDIIKSLAGNENSESFFAIKKVLELIEEDEKEQIEKSKYQGWSNYETWDYMLWLSNNEGDYDLVNENLIAFYKQAKTIKHRTREQITIQNLANWLEGYIQEGYPLPDSGHGVYSDLLNNAVGSIDYHEIATSWFNDYDWKSSEFGGSEYGPYDPDDPADRVFKACDDAFKGNKTIFILGD
jgi:hypothetical protein